MSQQYNPPPLWSLRLSLPIFRFVMNLAAHMPGGRYWRFVQLVDWSKRAVDRGANDRATKFANELLALAKRYSDDWNYGNAIHHGHLVLGRVALAAGDLEGARFELLAAGRTPGSPQLDSFGPNMRLANDLLAAGEIEVVQEYFELCRAFWKLGAEHIEEWAADIAAGRAPKFGPNLVY
jgi:hypothetical protein